MIKFGPSTTSNTQVIGIIQGYMKEEFSLSEEDVVMVSQLQCSEPGCPPVETVITIFYEGGKPKKFKILKPMNEVTKQDVNELHHSQHKCDHE